MADVARLNVELDHELDQKLAKLIPQGMKSIIVRTMLEILVEDIETHGSGVIGLVLDRKYRFTKDGQILTVTRRDDDKAAG